MLSELVSIGIVFFRGVGVSFFRGKVETVGCTPCGWLLRVDFSHWKVRVVRLSVSATVIAGLDAGKCRGEIRPLGIPVIWGRRISGGTSWNRKPPRCRNA